MAIRVGINGFGRIGRVVIRAAMDMPEIEIRAINLRNADLEYMVYMLKYDTVFGRFPKSLDHDQSGIYTMASMSMYFPAPMRWKFHGKKPASIMSSIVPALMSRPKRRWIISKQVRSTSLFPHRLRIKRRRPLSTASITKHTAQI